MDHFAEYLVNSASQGELNVTLITPLFCFISCVDLQIQLNPGSLICIRNSQANSNLIQKVTLQKISGRWQDWRSLTLWRFQARAGQPKSRSSQASAPPHSSSHTNKKSAREDRHHHQGRKVGVVARTNNKNNWLAPTAVDVQLSCVCKWWWCQPKQLLQQCHAPTTG